MSDRVGDRICKHLASLGAGSFARDVTKLSFGTLGGRIITFGALPILTRLYGPEDFAILAVYLALVSTVAVAACLRLEIGIPLAKSDDDARDLLGLALLALGLVTLIMLILVLVIPQQIALWLGKPEIEPYVWLIPLGIMLAGSYSLFQHWMTRARRFGPVARTRVGQAVTGVVTMISLGWAGFVPLGLLLGNMLNIGAGGVSLAIQAWRRDRTKLSGISFRRMGDTLLRYRHYPAFSTPESLINVAGIQAPMLLIAAHAGAEAGFLLLAMQVVSAPMSLLGSSISQVYMSHAPDAQRDGRLADFTLSIMRKLVLVGVGPLMLAGALVPMAFPIIFGLEWVRAGEMVTWLVPWMILQFITSPVSMVMFVAGRGELMLVLTVFGLIFRAGGALFGLYFDQTLMILGFVIGSAVYYFVLFLFVSRASGFNQSHLSSLFSVIFDIRVIAPSSVSVFILSYT